MLSRTLFLSLDPYMRGRISEVRSYAAGVAVGQVIVGGTVGEVVDSRHPAFVPGDVVVGASGWQAYGVSAGATLRKLDPQQAPISTALGVLGMPGLTAYVGLLDIGQPRSGETVVVSAASGAVGAVVGQIASSGLPRGGRCRQRREVRVRDARARIRRLRESSVGCARVRAEGRLSAGDRRLLRQRGRRDAGCRAHADQRERHGFHSAA